ncbi:hypothetical protein [Dyadobacter arcticus]|uniref:Glycosyltransferase RgtA/B/C/D-like domain-containing protein n=1 Tax=Dyadobacter arcticus TaxID=1078754 RepID=A0ABX0UDJ8_9BACT|nr:hypothetical protein [Dyadobacter arcticus]NIJ50997.1 hypothetical protein [Dyadobacter arcticus]
MITFDHSPTVYWLIGYILAGLVVLSSSSKRVSTPFFLLSCILLLAFMRLPVIVFNRELNADESQMLSHAITLFQDPIYWRSVDGTTIGPLDNYVLVIPKLLGFQINYTSGRVMGLLCSAGSLIFLFFTLKNWFSSNTARLLALIPLIFLSFTQEVDFVHNSSEQLPVFLLSVAIWLLSRFKLSQISVRANAYSLGFVAGAIPFAKLQAVPLALVIALAAGWFCYLQFRQVKDYRPLIALILGGFTFPLAVLLWTLSFHVFTDLIDFYLLGNAIYAGGPGLTGIPSQFLKIFKLSLDFQIFTLALSVPIILGFIAFVRLPKKKTEDYEVPVIIWLLVLSSSYAVTKSGNDFTHYFNFCIIPWTLLAGYGMMKLEKLSLSFSAIILLWFAGNDAYYFVKERRLNHFYSVNATGLGQSPVVKELKKFSREGDYMAVWGWQCTYYVEAQLAQGTAENHSERSIFGHAMQQTYRSRYLSDIQRTKPAFVLDAVGKNSFWVQNKTTQGIESYPELFQYVRKNYTFAGSFDDTRLFIRKDRPRSR